MKPAERIVLAGKFVRLEPIEERHRDDILAAAAQDPATFRYLFTDLSRGESVWPGRRFRSRNGTASRWKLSGRGGHPSS